LVDSVQKLVLQNIKTKLEELTWPSLVEFERIRLYSSDFKDHEIPAIQIYDVGETARTVQGRTENEWTLTIELILRPLQDDVADQGLLFDRKLEIKRKLGEDPTLGLGSLVPSQGRFKHIKYIRGLTDLHILSPYFMARLDYQALFEEPFSSEC